MSAPDTVYIIDDDESVRQSLSVYLTSVGIECKTFPDAATFLAETSPGLRGCVVVDVRMPGISGLDLQQRMRRLGYTLPVIIITAHGDVPMAVRAMKAGAADFVEKPFSAARFRETVRQALAEDQSAWRRRLNEETLRARLALLTPRQREILDRVARGQYNKVIADELGISLSTVEAHRKKTMEKLHAETLYDLIRIAEFARNEDEHGA